MSASQRRKGAGGEREVVRILREAIGVEIVRNWTEQFAGGADDIVGVPGWSIEVKRCKQASIREWWQQTISQAEKRQAKPVLIYRLDGQGRGLADDEKWRAIVPLYSIYQTANREYTVEMTLKAWVHILRTCGCFPTGPAF